MGRRVTNSQARRAKRRLEALWGDQEAWEDLCDGCGLCCAYLFTDIACTQLNLHTCQCKDYENRFKLAPHCRRVTPEYVMRMWGRFPETCGYRRHALDEPLPEWHHQNTGSRESVHEAGASARGTLCSGQLMRLMRGEKINA